MKGPPSMQIRSEVKPRNNIGNTGGRIILCTVANLRRRRRKDEKGVGVVVARAIHYCGR